ncbi:MAG: hypothetical protein Tsb009_08490 [Planctomycetaceae bacterium]
MSEFTKETADFVVKACVDNLAAITESLQMNFGGEVQLQAGESKDWNQDLLSEEFSGPGVMVVIEVGGRGIACLIPESLPLPDWYRTPSDSESARLQTVAMEWGLGMLPEDLDAERTEVLVLENLRDSLLEAKPAEDAVCIELMKTANGEASEPTDQAESDSDAENATNEDAEDEQEAEGDSPEEQSTEDKNESPPSQPRILIVAPVEKLPQAAEQSVEETPDASADSGSDTGQPSGQTSSSDSEAGLRGQIQKNLERLLPLKVTVSVRVAEKKIDVGHLMKITPGALIKFNKSCDDLLDLYVNNAHYCRGEAVKIGESFGLEVVDVGITEPREPGVLEVE